VQRQLVEVTQAPAEVSIPEGLRDEFNSFASKYPALASLLKENSVSGDVLRRKLETYGADEAADYAALVAESRLGAKRIEQNREQAQAQQYAQAWQTEVFVAVPEFRQAFESGQGHQFTQAVEKWIKSKPYTEAETLMGIYNNGDARQTGVMLKAFLAETKAAESAAVKDVAMAMAAVPGNQRPTPQKTEVDKNDEDAAWK
jgi:hypothetical protein